MFSDILKGIHLESDLDSYIPGYQAWIPSHAYDDDIYVSHSVRVITHEQVAL